MTELKNCKLIILIVFLQTVLSPVFVSAQELFERKIIIENDSFYAVVINPETQIGKLFRGSVMEPLDSADVFVIPAGARQRNLNPQPFSWTIYHDTLYCINATEYAQNTPVNSLKLIPLKNLEVYNAAEKPTKYLLQAAYANCPIRNVPLVQAYKKYVYVDDLYYDLLIWDGILYELVCVKNELTIWRFDEGQWIPSEVIPFEASGYFWAYAGDLMHIVGTSGNHLIYPPAKQVATSDNSDSGNQILIDDRDSGRIYFLSQDLFNEYRELSVKEILTK